MMNKIDYNANIRGLVNTLLDDEKSAVSFSFNEADTYGELTLKIQFPKKDELGPEITKDKTEEKC